MRRSFDGKEAEHLMQCELTWLSGKSSHHMSDDSDVQVDGSSRFRAPRFCVLTVQGSRSGAQAAHVLWKQCDALAPENGRSAVR